MFRIRYTFLMTSTKHTFKDSLNLPQTNFPMKANLHQFEPQRLKKWEAHHNYSTLMNAHKSAPLFVCHDGPPYANGAIHVGHLLNKLLKDMVVRSQFTQGRYGPFTPGWDCHGLPIEHKVLRELSPEKKSKLSTLSSNDQRLAIRNICKAYAEKHVAQQSAQMKRLLTLADYDNPYLTFSPAFESDVLNVFAKMVSEGIVFRQLKPVHWSISNQTALADAELEYRDHVSQTAGVAFPIRHHSFDTSLPVYALIWTTTPWTLPANQAIAFNPLMDYVLAEHANRAYIVARERVDYLNSHVSSPVITHPIAATALTNLVAQHPFMDQSAPLLAADFVTADDGTGLVHIAPGHGLDDYILGKAHNLPIYSPVDADGTFNDTIPWLTGVSVWDANTIICDTLAGSGHLVFAYEYTHSYPHDWRSKTPVIFRSTDQWFIGMDIPLSGTKKTLRDMALEAIDTTIDFHPASGRSRLRSMIASRPDWCISRQRSWGLPIPAFIDPTGTILLTEMSVNHIAKRIQKEGSDCWYRQSASELLADYTIESDPMAPLFDIAQATPLYDIFDVWFESGASWHAALYRTLNTSQADVYLEGSDQHRGWFQLSLLTSLAVQHKPPFKTLVTHGFIVDKDGRKLSKSSGNALTVDELLKTHGAEVLRWWTSSLSYENDIKVDNRFFIEAGDHYRKIRNTFRFMLSTIWDLPDGLSDCLNRIPSFSNTSIDCYVLHQLHHLEKRVLSGYATYQFQFVSTALYDFCNDTLSAFYLSSIKDRLYCDKPDSPRRRQSQQTLRIIVDSLIRLFSPILPHTCDEIRESLSGNNASSAQGQPALTIAPPDIHPQWPAIIPLRKHVLKALESAKQDGIENSLDAAVSIPQTIDSAFLPELPDLFGVSRVFFHNGPIRINSLMDEPRCERSWKRDATVKQRPNGHMLSDRDYDAIQ